MSKGLGIERLEARWLRAATPAGFVESTFATGLDHATAMAVLPDGRELVAQKLGTVALIKGGVVQSTPALSLSVQTDGERGVVGIAVDPKFATNHYIYVDYVAKGKAYDQVSRFTMNGDTVTPGSQLVLLKVDAEQYGAQHVGGGLAFGADGKLYLGVGDNENPADGQSLATLHGKLLRINPNGSIPSDNPYYDQLAGALKSIYAIGLRNPYTLASDPKTGTLYVNDVGEQSFEEIDQARRGANFGWPQTEGPTTAAGLDTPAYAYGPPGDGTRVCVIGGAFYNGTQFPAAYAGQYFFADFVQGTIKTFDPITKAVTPFAASEGKIVDLDVTPDGTLLVTTFDGDVKAFKYTGDTTPPPGTGTGTGTASIGGYVVNDRNANGKWDSGETGITGRTVWLDLDADGVQDADEPTAITGSNGRFVFGALDAGTYRVREVVPAGSRQTSPVNDGSLFVSLTPGQARSGVSFQVTTS